MGGDCVGVKILLRGDRGGVVAAGPRDGPYMERRPAVSEAVSVSRAHASALKGGFPTTRVGLISSPGNGLGSPAPRVRRLESGRVSTISLSLDLLRRAAVRVKDISTRGLSAGVGSQRVKPCTPYGGLGRTTSEETIGFPKERRGGRFPASSHIDNKN